jgi:hypothetical protein
MPGKNRIQLNGFGRLGRIQEHVFAASLDSLNVRQMADVPEIGIDKMEDKEATERFRREWKASQYADLKGRRFRPTFSSNIDFFEIRGYDAERDMVLTTAHPKSGIAFDDEIEERYLAGAFATGEYVALPLTAQPGETVYVLHNYHMPETTRAVRQQKFCGPSCARCHHRFGTTSNAAWCDTPWQQSRCYRFKLEKR